MIYSLCHEAAMNGIGNAELKFELEVTTRWIPVTYSRLLTHTYDTKYGTFHSDNFPENSFWNLLVTITYSRHCYF